MKKIFNIMTTILLFGCLLVGCGSDKTEGNKEESSQEEIWSRCILNGFESIQEKITLKSNVFNKQVITYSKGPCESADYSLEFAGTYVLNKQKDDDASKPVQNLNVNYSSVSLSVFSENSLKIFQNQTYCDFSNLKIDTSFDFSNCYFELRQGRGYFDIVEISDDNMYIGLINEDDLETGKTEAKRPSQLDNVLPFNKGDFQVEVTESNICKQELSLGLGCKTMINPGGQTTTPINKYILNTTDEGPYQITLSGSPKSDLDWNIYPYGATGLLVSVASCDDEENLDTISCQANLEANTKYTLYVENDSLHRTNYTLTFQQL